MKTSGEIEAAVCEGMSRFQQEYMGRGPRDIRAHLIDDLLVIRLQGVLKSRLATGGHGFGLWIRPMAVTSWTDRLNDWMTDMGYMKKP